MSRVLALAVALTLLLCGSVGLAAPPSHAPVRLTVDRSAISTGIGHTFVFRTRIANTGATDLTGVIAHLNVLSVRAGTYVDPEDWSSQRTRYLAPLPPGRSATISWKLAAVNTGRFSVYVALLRGDGTALLDVSSPLRVQVADRKTLDSGGILPLALGLPALLGLIWALVRLGRSRSVA